MTMKRDTPASRARASTESRSPSNCVSVKWQCESASFIVNVERGLVISVPDAPVERLDPRAGRTYAIFLREDSAVLKVCCSFPARMAGVIGLPHVTPLKDYAVWLRRAASVPGSWRE